MYEDEDDIEDPIENYYDVELESEIEEEEEEDSDFNLTITIKETGEVIDVGKI